MEIQRSKQLKIIGLIVGLILLALSLIGGVIALFVTNNNTKRELDNIYQRSFYELSDASNNLEMSLSKLLASGTDEQSSVLAMQAYNNAQTASDALTRLPLEHIDIATAEKFYNQVGDFSLSLNKSMAYKRDSALYKDKIEDLYIAARAINQMIIEEGEILKRNNFSFSSMNKAKEKQNRAAEANDHTTDNNSYASVEYPELIYDGPFSDSTSKRCYKALENLPLITFDEAAVKVREMLPFNIGEVTLLGETDTSAPCFVINATSDAGDIICLVSKNGGMFLSISFYAPSGESILDEDAAKVKAREWASHFGFEVEPVWYNELDGTATINLAPIKDEVVYYTDLVKVKINLGDGSFKGLEATGYCMNNCERSFCPALTESEAKERVSAKLTINSCRLAVVPDGEESEALAYEIAAEYKGLDYFIYIGADDGREINIMRVVDGKQGKLTF